MPLQGRYVLVFYLIENIIARGVAKATEIPTKDNPDPQQVVHHDPDSKEDERKPNEELESLRDRYDNGLPRTVLSVCPHCGRWISEIHLSIYFA